MAPNPIFHKLRNVFADMLLVWGLLTFSAIAMIGLIGVLMFGSWLAIHSVLAALFTNHHAFYSDTPAWVDVVSAIVAGISGIAGFIGFAFAIDTNFWHTDQKEKEE